MASVNPNVRAGIAMGTARAEGWHWVDGKGWVDDATGEVVIPDPKTQVAPKPLKDTHHNNYTPVGGGGGSYDLSGFDAGAVAEAQQEAYDFGQILGWPKWYDAAAIEKDILQANMQADANQASQFIWSLLKPDQQKDNINAYFGLTKQQYTEKLNNLKDMFNMYTGSDQVPDDIRNKALRENWTQTELMTALEKDPTIGATAPWLMAGQTFRDVQAQFTQLYGQAPAGAAQLGSWWKFRAGAQAVNAGGPAQQVANPPPALVSRQLTADVAVR